MKNKISFGIIIVLLIAFIFPIINANAVTLPFLSITSNNYSVGDKETLNEVESIDVGDSIRLYAIVNYGNDVYDPYNPDSMGLYVQQVDLEGVEWSTNDPEIAIVDNNGLVTGLSAGLVTISAHYNDWDAQYELNVQSNDSKYRIDVSTLKYSQNNVERDMKTYSLDEYGDFLEDYNAGHLPNVYVTNFLFDGVSTVKGYDLDDFIESGNDVNVKTITAKVFNIKNLGDYEFTGSISGGMIAVNTNNLTGDINLILNNLTLDTDSKKLPAVYVYNKDITYTGCKVTIKTVLNTENSLVGGKFKKTSMIGKDELDSYANYYSGDMKTNYQNYTNYYGVYFAEQINDVLFAKVQADSDDLKDGDPYYFYKGAGAISSDIDLYFEGEGLLEVTSKNKEGIESKGNLSFVGGKGDYSIYAEDDCLNTTTKSNSTQNARNTLTIDVNSLIAMVDSSEEADEGDGIDSNGSLIINGGLVIAYAHPGQDAGIDSESGIIINGGTVLATGDMYDQISDQSQQNFMVLNFNNKQVKDSLIAIVNENNELLMVLKAFSDYSKLIYSSPNLTEGNYTIYKGGKVTGRDYYGFYTGVENYTKGVLQGYASKGNNMGPGGNQGEPPQRPDGDSNQAEPPQRPDNGGGQPEPPQRPNDDGNQMGPQNGGQQGGESLIPSNSSFMISGKSNIFNGVGDYQESNQNNNGNTNNITNNNTSNNNTNNTINTNTNKNTNSNSTINNMNTNTNSSSSNNNNSGTVNNINYNVPGNSTVTTYKDNTTSPNPLPYTGLLNDSLDKIKLGAIVTIIVSSVCIRIKKKKKRSNIY